MDAEQTIMTIEKETQDDLFQCIVFDDFNHADHYLRIGREKQLFQWYQLIDDEMWVKVDEESKIDVLETFYMKTEHNKTIFGEKIK